MQEHVKGLGLPTLVNLIIYYFRRWISAPWSSVL